MGPQNRGSPISHDTGTSQTRDNKLSKNALYLVSTFGIVRQLSTIVLNFTVVSWISLVTSVVFSVPHAKEERARFIVTRFSADRKQLIYRIAFVNKYELVVILK